MSASHSSTSLDGFVAEPPTRLTVVARREAHDPRPLQDGADLLERQGNRLQRRDRRIALALMVGSGLLSSMALYGAWTLLRTVI
ncbi:MAG: hypothetical protein ABSC95_03195 [Acetobacteraceae bacterium]|jgi:hypothetical protein